MDEINFEDKLKIYEGKDVRYLSKEEPTLIRITLKHSESFTEGFMKPFDLTMSQTMAKTAQYLCELIVGCKIAYIQNEEMLILVDSQQYYDLNNWLMTDFIERVTTTTFNNFLSDYVRSLSLSPMIYNNIKYVELVVNYGSKINSATFDVKLFNTPKEDVYNAFKCRQQTAIRKSIYALLTDVCDQETLDIKTYEQLLEILVQKKNINFDTINSFITRGVCVTKLINIKDDETENIWKLDMYIPIFTQDMNYIEKYL